MVRLLEYWQRLEAEKKEEEEENEEENNKADNEEFSLDIGNDSGREEEEEVENNTGIKINIEDATPQKEVGQPSFENSTGINTNSENGTISRKEDGRTDTTKQEESKAKQEKDGNTVDDGNSLPFIDTDEDENESKVPDITLTQETCQPKDVDKGNVDVAQGNANSGYKSGMKKFFQNVSEAQQGEEGDFSVESRYSDEDSEIKTILGSGQKTKRDSKYIIKSDEEAPNKSKVGKIPVLDTSESEFEEREFSKAGFSNFAFDDKE